MEEGFVDEEIEETTQETKAALEKIMNKLSGAAQLNNVPLQSSNSKFIKYKPTQQSAAFNERIIRMAEMPVDPLDPPKLKHKRVPKASGSPPVAVMHSPPRPVTVKDQQDWKIPPCISNWKNPKGYTIPLDMRLTADGRGLQVVQINDNFVKLSESLYVSEEKAREAVAMRSKVQKEMMTKEEERKKMDLRALAQSVRSMEKDVPMETKEEREKRMDREKIREERRRKRGRERRQKAKKSKISSDKDRDVSEKVALGMASVNSGRGGEVMYDQRLFNQEKGIDSGFATDDQYNVYDNGLFTAQPTLYRPKRDTYGGVDEHLDKIMKTDRFKPDKIFAGTSRDRPVEFEKEVEEADPFGLDQFLTKLKTGKK